MAGRKRMAWVTARDSLWLVPSTLTTLGAALALLLIQLERGGTIAIGGGEHWLLGGGGDGARAVLSAVATGLVTVTGVVFSVTVVALQLASSQFTPRLLRNFTSDRMNQVVLGVFIGTMTYALLVLRVVDSENGGEAGFIPRVAVAVGVLLFLISVGCLVYFIHHASRAIRIPVILEQVTRQTLRNVDHMFPARAGSPSAEEEVEEVPPGQPVTVTAEASGYLQAVDASALFDLGEGNELLIRMERRIGEYVLPHTRLASVWPGDTLGDDAIGAIRDAFVLGEERTPEQDVEFGVIEISDIAVKALSPGINDPRTAMHCIDRLTDILHRLGSRCAPPNARTLEGKVHFIARPLGFERAVSLAFDQIIHFGADNPAVVKKLIDSLAQLVELLPENRRAPLDAQREAVVGKSREAVPDRRDRQEIDRVARRTA